LLIRFVASRAPFSEFHRTKLGQLWLTSVDAESIRRESVGNPTLLLNLLNNGGYVQPGDIGMAVIIRKDNDVTATRMNRRVVRRGNGVFPAIARSD